MIKVGDKYIGNVPEMVSELIKQDEKQDTKISTLEEKTEDAETRIAALEEKAENKNFIKYKRLVALNPYDDLNYLNFDKDVRVLLTDNARKNAKTIRSLNCYGKKYGNQLFINGGKTIAAGKHEIGDLLSNIFGLNFSNKVSFQLLSDLYSNYDASTFIGKYLNNDLGALYSGSNLYYAEMFQEGVKGSILPKFRRIMQIDRVIENTYDGWCSPNFKLMLKFASEFEEIKKEKALYWKGNLARLYLEIEGCEIFDYETELHTVLMRVNVKRF